MNFYESFKNNLKESDLYTVRQDLINSGGKPYAGWYIDKTGTWASEELDDEYVYDKETAEKIAEELRKKNSGDSISVIKADYKPSKEELDKAIAELKNLEDDYERSKDMRIMQDGSLGLLSVQISKLEKKIERLKKALKEE